MATDPGRDTLPTAPQSLGKYRVLEVLGRGAMGVVYKGYDAAIDRPVALKTIHAELLRDSETTDWLARFRQEARAAGRCLHPNIVTVFDYGEADGTPYIAMEYVQGRELKHFLREQHRFELETVLLIIAQVLNALSYAHACGVVHRDIKPGNIMLLDDGQVKVADFGIARIDSVSTTQMGMAIGTPSYMAPEQFRGEQVDHRADLYATGVVLFELLTGQKPFPGKTATEIMYQVLHNAPGAVSALNQHVPPGLDAIVRKALHKDPALRFQSAGAFAQALEGVAPGSGIGPGVTSTDQTVLKSVVHLPAPGTGACPVEAWDDDALRQMEESLAFYIGPLARLLVRKTAREVDSLDALRQALAENIPQEQERRQFLRRAPRGGGNRGESSGSWSATGTGTNTGGEADRAAAFGTEVLDAAQRQLAVYLGPIARVLVKKTAGQAVSVEDLYRRLAEHIPQERQRSAFLRHAASDQSGH